MSFVLGIDFSSFYIDLVSIDADDLRPPLWRRFDLNGQDAFDRTRSVGDVMPNRHFAFWDDVLAVGIEHPGGPPQTVLAPMRVQGAVLSMIPARILVKPWPPSAWRKAVGLPGNASKTDVWSKVTFTDAGRDDKGAFVWPQDACDAYCIALATRNALDHQQAAA